MATVAERAIHGKFTRPRGKNVHDFGNHDWAMHTRRSFAGGNNLGDIVGIAFRRMLFVLLSKVPRTLSAIPRPPLRFFHTRRQSIYSTRAAPSQTVATDRRTG